jgi:hypothetical protein
MFRQRNSVREFNITTRSTRLVILLYLLLRQRGRDSSSRAAAVRIASLILGRLCVLLLTSELSF